MNHYPTTHDLKSPESLERVIRDIYTKLYGYKENLSNDVEQVKLQIPNPVQLMQQTQTQLQMGGITPLNVTGLLGKLAEPQYASIPEVSSLPNPDDPLAQDTGVVRYNGTIYVFSTASGAPGSWVALGAVAYASVGTYAARPAATVADNGKLYWASDQYAMYIIVAGAWVSLTHPLTVSVSTTPYSATYATPHLLVDATAGAITVNLPDGYAGALMTIKKVDSGTNAVIITPAVGKTIDGSATISLLMEGENVIIKSDSSGNWWVL